MGSTFFGLETAKRGMYAQQGALYVTGHNISNANTPGYSRQRVNFQQTTPFASPGMNRPGGAGQFGTGVESGSIQRIRDNFADVQFRTQNNSVGYYGSQYEALTKMEEIMNEPSDSGLHSVMEKFWNSLQTLATHPENSGARDVVVKNGEMVADTFNYYMNSLTRVNNDLGNQIDVKTQEINETLDSIYKLNKQISEVEPHGYLPNDLYDARDALVDKLSGMVNINVTKVTPTAYGNASPLAEGLYNIEILRADGTSYQPKLNLIRADETGLKEINKISIEPNLKENPGAPVTEISIGSTTLKGEDMNVGGELAGLVESYGYDVGTPGAPNIKGTYPEMLEKINKMAKAFAEEFNRIHSNGKALDGSAGLPFFIIDPNDPNPAKNLKVNDALIKDSSLFAAGLENGDSGNNLNAQLLADLKTKAFANYGQDKDKDGNWTGTPTNPDGLTGNLDTFYSGVIGSLGVTSQGAAKNLQNAGTIAISVEQRRQSVSAVSIDEEMVNMIKFQHAYNASARNITVVDEMLDKIINGLGVGGR